MSGRLPNVCECVWYLSPHSISMPGTAEVHYIWPNTNPSQSHAVYSIRTTTHAAHDKEGQPHAYAVRSILNTCSCEQSSGSDTSVCSKTSYSELHTYILRQNTVSPFLTRAFCRSYSFHYKRHHSECTACIAVR